MLLFKEKYSIINLDFFVTFIQMQSTPLRLEKVTCCFSLKGEKMKKGFRAIFLIMLVLLLVGSLISTKHKMKARQQLQKLLLANAEHYIAIRDGQERDKELAQSPLYGLKSHPSFVKLEERNAISFEDFVSSVENFLPSNKLGEVTTYREGYEILKEHEDAFYYIPTQHNLDPRYIFCLAIWTSGYGSSEFAYLENDIFGLGEIQPSIPFALIKYCSLLEDDEQYFQEPEVLELIQEIFPE